MGVQSLYVDVVLAQLLQEGGRFLARSQLAVLAKLAVRMPHTRGNVWSLVSDRLKALVAAAWGIVPVLRSGRAGL